MAAKFTKRDLEKFRTVFEKFKSDSGNIPNELLKTVLWNLGQEATEDEMEELIKDIDTDASGEVDFDEFVVMMANNLDEDKARDAFRCATDGEDTMDMKDVRAIIRDITEISDDLIRNIICELDPSRTGKVKLDRFKKVFCF